MATSGKKITELDTLAAAANSDLLYVVHDPAGVPTSNKITVTNLLKSIVNSNTAPTSNSVAGTKGQMVYNGNYLYICVAANTWIRASVSTSW